MFIVLFLPSEHGLVESDIFSICPAEIVEPSCHIYSEIAPVPWLDHISIDSFSLLVTLVPSVEVCICLEPLHIASVAGVFDKVLCSRRIEYIDSETELMLTITWRSTVCI